MFLETTYLERLKGMEKAKNSSFNISWRGAGGKTRWLSLLHKAFENNWEDMEDKTWKEREMAELGIKRGEMEEAWREIIQRWEKIAWS